MQSVKYLSLSFSHFLTLPDWPSGFVVLSKLRIHTIGYPQRARLARVIWKATQLDMIVTVAPVVWRRLGKLWQKYTIPATMPRGLVFKTVKSFLFFQLHQWMDLRSIQQMIFAIWGYKLTIARLKWWIIRRRLGKEPA
jgi:hypothetical protein